MSVPNESIRHTLKLRAAASETVGRHITEAGEEMGPPLEPL